MNTQERREQQTRLPQATDETATRRPRADPEPRPALRDKQGCQTRGANTAASAKAPRWLKEDPGPPREACRPVDVLAPKRPPAAPGRPSYMAPQTAEPQAYAKSASYMWCLSGDGSSGSLSHAYYGGASMAGPKFDRPKLVPKKDAQGWEFDDTLLFWLRFRRRC